MQCFYSTYTDIVFYINCVFVNVHVFVHQQKLIIKKHIYFRRYATRKSKKLS